MKRTTTMTVAALIVATITTGAALPAFAQDRAPDRGPQAHQRGPGEGVWIHRDGPRRGAMLPGHRGRDQMRIGIRRGAGGGVFALVCSDRGTDRLEHMLLNMRQRTDPTSEQQALFETFHDAVITAQSDFADACTTARSAGADDLAARLKVRLDIEKAHVEAMTAVLPSFEAFFGSLTDEQKQALEPRRRGGPRILDEPGAREHGRPNSERHT